MAQEKINEVSTLTTECEHNFSTIVITGKKDMFGVGVHLASIIEQCKYCYGIRVIEYKTDMWYEAKVIMGEE